MKRNLKQIQVYIRCIAGKNYLIIKCISVSASRKKSDSSTFWKHVEGFDFKNNIDAKMF